MEEIIEWRKQAVIIQQRGNTKHATSHHIQRIDIYFQTHTRRQAQMRQEVSGSGLVSRILIWDRDFGVRP